MNGVVRADGGITIDDAVLSGSDLQTMQNTFDWCNFTQAASAATSGSVSGNQLTLTRLISVPCNYTNRVQTVGSTISPAATVGTPTHKTARELAASFTAGGALVAVFSTLVQAEVWLERARKE